MPSHVFHQSHNRLTSLKRPIVDFLSPALDTLFTLSRLALVAHKPETYDTSYDLLMRTLSLPGIAMSPTSEDGKGKSKVNAEVIHPVAHANYIRCISGAFHNLSAALYQAGKYGVAARFLEKGCTLGVQALASYRLASVSQSEQSPEGETGEKQQVWTQLVEQVHRRWELLGVCQMKTGDRKVRLKPLCETVSPNLCPQAAYNAFVEAIKAYLYDNTTFVDVTGNSGIKSIFESTTHQQLANLVDRATYLAANELFMAAAEVPLSHALNAEFPMSTSGAVLGAVLEQQVDGLEGSKWKPATREITKAILSEALRVYVAEETPVRRARVLVKCLEYAYHESPDTLNVEGYLGRHATDVLAEVQKLVVQEVCSSEAYSSHNGLLADTGVVFRRPPCALPAAIPCVRSSLVRAAQSSRRSCSIVVHGRRELRGGVQGHEGFAWRSRQYHKSQEGFIAQSIKNGTNQSIEGSPSESRSYN